MAKLFLICILLLVFTFDCTYSARILDEATPATTATTTTPEEANPPDADIPAVTPPVTPTVASPVTADPPEADTPEDTTPVAPAVAAPTTAGPPEEDTPEETTPVAPVVAAPATAGPPETNEVAPPVAPVVTAPVVNPAAPVVGPTTGPTSTVANPATDHATFSFFMHDILGGTHPSGRVVTGIVTSTNAVTQNLPFTKDNNQIFPINGGVPLNTINDVINNNNYPFLVGLNGQQQQQTATVVQNAGNNNIASADNNQPFVTAGQLPSGLSLQQLMFGSITVVDNQITEGHELGSAVLGRAQGFYLTSSLDGTSHTLALTALFHNEHEHENEHELGDTISFFGVHRTATPISHLAIIGGSGKYETAKGYATIETLPEVDQHLTDGVETITHFTVYLTP